MATFDMQIIRKPWTINWLGMPGRWYSALQKNMLMRGFLLHFFILFSILRDFIFFFNIGYEIFLSEIRIPFCLNNPGFMIATRLIWLE